MAHAEKCPLCDGTGCKGGFAEYADCPISCHGCGGKGWVSVDGTLPSEASDIAPSWQYVADIGFNLAAGQKNVKQH